MKWRTRKRDEDEDERTIPFHRPRAALIHSLSSLKMNFPFRSSTQIFAEKDAKKRNFPPSDDYSFYAERSNLSKMHPHRHFVVENLLGGLGQRRESTKFIAATRPFSLWPL